MGSCDRCREGVAGTKACRGVLLIKGLPQLNTSGGKSGEEAGSRCFCVCAVVASKQPNGNIASLMSYAVP